MLDNRNGQAIAGTAGVPPANEGEARNELGAFSEGLRAFGAFAGGTPAVPANRLKGITPVVVVLWRR